MVFPTEEEIEVIVSEARSMGGIAHGEDGEGNESHSADGCEFCSFNEELNKRAECAEESLCKIDWLARNAFEKLPGTSIAMLIGGANLCSAILVIARICFYVGYKAGRNQSYAEKMEF